MSAAPLQPIAEAIEAQLADERARARADLDRRQAEAEARADEDYCLQRLRRGLRPSLLAKAAKTMGISKACIDAAVARHEAETAPPPAAETGADGAGGPPPAAGGDDGRWRREARPSGRRPRPGREEAGVARLDRSELDRLRDGLIATIDHWVPLRFPGARRDGALYRMWDRDGGRGEACVVNRAGARAGQYHDFWAGEHGGVFDLWMRAIRARDFRAALVEAARYLAEPAVLAALERAPDRERRQREGDEDQRRRARAARHLFLEAAPLPGSPAEAYLLGRGLDVSRLPCPPGALRHHPALRCPETHRETGLLRPALVAAVTWPDGSFGALHRTFLERASDGVWRKAGDMRAPKASLGPVGGGLIPLARGASRAPWSRRPAGEDVYVTEGIEDGLAVALALPGARVVAALSLGNFARLPPLADGGRWIFCGQNDDDPHLVERLMAAAAALGGIVVRPPAGVADWADWARAIREAAPAAAGTEGAA